MKKAPLLSAVLLFGVCSFADTTINNFNGYNDAYFPFGGDARSIQTFGEVFTAPQGINNISSFSFYMGDPLYSGDIIAGAYIATWTGAHAGTLLYDSGQFIYSNNGNQELTFTTSNVILAPVTRTLCF